MKKISLIASACFLLLTSMIGINEVNKTTTSDNDEKKEISKEDNEMAMVNMWMDSMYNTLNLETSGLSKEAFVSACKGYEYLISEDKLANPYLLTIADFSQSSTSKRLFVIDMQHSKILYNTYVSHGKNSGVEYATKFSNKNDSHKSSLGFMITAETYFGGNGYSMRFDGVEKNINDNVRDRDIVMHGSNYVNESRASSGTMMGRSYGCPAVPAAISKKIIDCIKGGSCFYAYYPDKSYLANSQILTADFEWPITAALKPVSGFYADSLARPDQIYDVAGRIRPIKIL